MIWSFAVKKIEQFNIQQWRCMGSRNKLLVCKPHCQLTQLHVYMQTQDCDIENYMKKSCSCMHTCLYGAKAQYQSKEMHQSEIVMKKVKMLRNSANFMHRLQRYLQCPPTENRLCKWADRSVWKGSLFKYKPEWCACL